jgi:hypothetical protein
MVLQALEFLLVFYFLSTKIERVDGFPFGLSLRSADDLN